MASEVKVTPEMEAFHQEVHKMHLNHYGWQPIGHAQRA